jgi:CO/xanthine dehydrogenase Mo-binding subunit/aerobic-type carbon monoxide dehydrogenase small subunit (CoxS/CutS family)
VQGRKLSKAEEEQWFCLSPRKELRNLDRSKILLTVNGEKREFFVEPGAKLIRVLRDNLGLAGAKEGCGTGHCGSCTVILNGKKVKSCVTPIEQANGGEILTIEGLGTPENPHPIQEAFINAGAVQCGFCTPGMILTAKILLDKNPQPTREDIIREFSPNLCRCTGYEPIVKGVQLAAKVLAETENLTKGMGLVGESIPQSNALGKANGTAVYAADIKRANMSCVKILRSPHHHAKILAIDTSAAEKFPGIEIILTARDIPGTNCLGPVVEDQPVMADGVVRFLGEPVAIVVANSERAAEEGLGLIKVRYEQLEAVLDPAAVLEPGTPLVHQKGNLAFSRVLFKGDAEQGFSEADVVLEETFFTPAQEHAYLEPESALAEIDENGRVVVYGGTQAVNYNQREIAKLLGLDLNQVRVVQTTTGGGFGGRIEGLAKYMVALAAFYTRKPARLVFSREESLLVSYKRHPFKVTAKLGATREGKLVALQMDALLDAGAYTSWTPGVVTKSTIHFTGPYVIPNVKFKGQAVFTHKAVSGAMRGYGAPQVQFALECLLDAMAKKLGIDPWQFRYQNLMAEGSITATRQQLDESVSISECMEAVREHYFARKKIIEQENSEQLRLGTNIRKGLGIACTIHGVGKTGYGNYTEAAVQMQRDGSVTIFSGAADIGQGLNTILAQIAATELNQSTENVSVVSSDTLLTPDGDITCASKQSYISGNAVKKAVCELKSRLLKKASEIMNVPIDDLVLTSQGIVDAKNPGQIISCRQLAELVPERITASHDVDVTKLDEKDGQGKPYETYSYGAHLVETQVNMDTGQIKVVEVHAAHDVGKAINPQGVEGQIYGGVVMGLGYALKENYIYGQTKSFRDYKLPKFSDLPEIHTYIIEKPVTSGPFGAKGTGECTINPVAPAIANAVHHATGILSTQLPIRLEVFPAKEGER